MNAGIMHKTIEDLRDIQTVLIVALHHERLDEEERRVITKGAIEMTQALLRDLLHVSPPLPEDASKPS